MDNEAIDNLGTIDNTDWATQRDESKALGDSAFRIGDYDLAIQHYTEALSLDPDHAALLSNRSAAYLLTSQKSKALYDAEACVKIGTMGNKGISRLAAALQSLGRYQHAIDQWKAILKDDPNHAAAVRGRDDCATALHSLKQQDISTKEVEENQNVEETGESITKNDDDDDLDDFFNDVQEATAHVIKEKELEADAKPEATNAIKNHKTDLGTAASQIERILPENYFWHNLNPFRVFDISHTASQEEISRRYKALSLLLHPDKNPGLNRAQEAYDEVLRAKAILLGTDENKVCHMKALVEQGTIRGTVEFKKLTIEEQKESSIEEYQSKAVMKLFAEIENKRRQVEKNEKSHQQRERQHEEDQLQKEKNSRKFDKNWQEEDRVDKRIGNWRDFQGNKKKKI